MGFKKNEADDAKDSVKATYVPMDVPIEKRIMEVTYNNHTAKAQFFLLSMSIISYLNHSDKHAHTITSYVFQHLRYLN